MMPDHHSYRNVRDWLKECRRPLLVTHRRPDGDAIGALTAMTLALPELGLEPRPALFEPFPQRYGLLRGLVAWHDWQASRQVLTAECDALVILDTCAWSQLEAIADYLPQAPRTLVIDHHPTRDPIATRPGDLRLLDQTAGAVCLLIAEWLQAVGLSCTPPIATALMVGLGTDCGWFRFPNTDPRMLEMAAQLARAGAQPHLIYHSVYEQDPPARLRLIGRMLQSLELLADGRLAVMRLAAADLAAAGADGSMTEDLVNEASRLGSTEATLLFTEETDGRVRVNLRSRQWLDVAALASRFGGGGHARAAGVRLPGPLDQAVTRVVDATLAALAER